MSSTFTMHKIIMGKIFRYNKNHPSILHFVRKQRYQFNHNSVCVGLTFMLKTARIICLMTIIKINKRFRNSKWVPNGHTYNVVVLKRFSDNKLTELLLHNDKTRLAGRQR